MKNYTKFVNKYLAVDGLSILILRIVNLLAGPVAANV
jgi:hypothetical protein